MKAFEFQAQVNPDGTVAIPADLCKQISPNQAVRVLLLIAEPNEEAVWSRLTSEQFLQGYDASDAIYDNLTSAAQN